MFKNASVQNRLLIAFFVIALVGVLTATWNIFIVLQMDEKMAQITDKVDELINTEESQVYFLEQELASKDYMLTGDPYYLNKFEEFGVISDKFLNEALMYAGTEDEVSRIVALSEEMAIYEHLHSVILGKFAGLEPGEDVSDLIDEIDAEVNRVHRSAESLSRRGQESLGEEIDNVEDLVNLSILIGVFSLGVFSMLALMASVTTGQVAEPILHLTNAVVAFESGQYRSGNLEGITERRDEIGSLANAFDRMVESIETGNKERETMMEATRRFVPYEYLDFLQKNDITEIRLGDHVSAEMAIMFSDIRSFTTISESMSPQENFDFVNTYLSRVSPSIQKQDGFVVKFLGDGMMAIFPYGVDDAVKAGIEKYDVIRKYNQEREKYGEHPIDVGIGIHTGHMMVGMIGEEERMQGDAFSDNVNLTSRLEGLTKYFGISIILSEETYMRMQRASDYLIRFLGKTQVKGRDRPIGLYELYDNDPEEIRKLKIESLEIFNKAVDLFGGGKIRQARTEFRKVLKLNPDDRPAKFYDEHIAQLLKENASSAWDGVIRMTSK